jgi:hypothetical protein
MLAYELEKSDFCPKIGFGGSQSPSRRNKSEINERI